MPIRAVIDLAALRANFALLRRAAPGARAMAVVKSDAYGHGAVRVATALDDADGYAVARLGEALALRAAGVTKPILLLEGVFSSDELVQALAARLDLVVHDLSQVEMLEQTAGVAGDPSSRPVVWLKVDTGMNRLGFRPEQTLAARTRLLAARSAPRELRLMTHLARADEPDMAPTAAQVVRFDSLVAEWTAAAGARPVTSIGNSAGTLRGSAAQRATQGDWIRPGIALYGSSPAAGRSAAELGLRPVMTLETAVIALREVPVGEGVGYGATWRATRPSRIAILAAGYADGVPRHLPSGAPVLVDGRSAPLAGRVSMDMIAVDVTDLPSVAVGVRAVLWGAGLPADEVAARAGTIAYELFCGVAPRVPREYL
ncbi:MAG: alanine racemase [Gammaproteobacteria bacterium]